MAHKTRVLLTGASGLLGRAIFSQLRKDDKLEVIGLAHRRIGEGLRQIDLTDAESVRKIFDDFKPEIVIHSAAVRFPDVMEKDPVGAGKLNIDATRLLCTEAARHNSWVLFISTDYVFDGTKPPYKESDENVNPLNKYGVSKRKGEIITLETNKKNAVLRVPVLFGDIEYLEESAITILYKILADSSKLTKISNYEKRYPCSTKDLALVISQMVEHKIEGKDDMTGYFHWSTTEPMTKYTIIMKMGEIFGLPTNHIEPDNNKSPGAPRPENVLLGTKRLESYKIGYRTPFVDAIKECITSFLERQCQKH